MIAAQHSELVNASYNRTRYVFAVFTACAIFTLILAGALVTSNDAGLSVPDWPTSFGSIYKIAPMVGGVRFEHSHCMLAEFVGLLTIILTLWTWRADERQWMRLSIAALAVVIMQGILGGLTVLSSSRSFYRSYGSRTNIFLYHSDHCDLYRPDVDDIAGGCRPTRWESDGTTRVDFGGGAVRPTHSRWAVPTRRPELVATCGKLDHRCRDAQMDHF